MINYRRFTGSLEDIKWKKTKLPSKSWNSLKTTVLICEWLTSRNGKNSRLIKLAEFAFKIGPINITYFSDPWYSFERRRQVRSNWISLLRWFCNPKFEWHPFKQLVSVYKKNYLVFLISVTRLGDILDFGQLLNALGNN